MSHLNMAHLFQNIGLVLSDTMYKLIRQIYFADI